MKVKLPRALWIGCLGIFEAHVYRICTKSMENYTQFSRRNFRHKTILNQGNGAAINIRLDRTRGNIQPCQESSCVLSLVVV